VARYGEFHLRCAVVYRSYGDALLQHYQKNSSVLGELISSDEDKKKKLMGNAEEMEGEDGPQGTTQNISARVLCVRATRKVTSVPCRTCALFSHMHL